MKNILKNIISSILIFESKLILKKYKPYVISITGSVGKTSTKDAVHTVVSPLEYTRKSTKSFNSEIGLPLTIIGCKNGWSDPFIWLNNILIGLELILFKSKYPKALVLEIGADRPGDIQSVSKWLQSDIVIINKVGDVPVHVELYPTVADVLKEKSHLIDSLKKDGTLVLYGDDKKVADLAQKVTQNVVTFGVSEAATVTASDISVAYDVNQKPEGMFFKLNYKRNSIPVKILGVLGAQQVYPVIAAATVGIVKNISITKIVESIASHVYPKGRMNIIAGLNGSILVDDSYNSSPDALREGLNTLASIQTTGKKIAVLGDMMELGSFSAEEHRKAGVQAVSSCDVLVTVGQRAKLMSNNAVQFDTAYEAGEYLKGIVGAGDIVYVKGSQSMRMERVSKALLAEPEKATDLLVRQEEEWLAKK